MQKILYLLFALSVANQSFAREGMWLPTLLHKYNIEEMQEMGFRLTAEDIYSINNNSMKDGVVLFGRGCTGVMVSDEGLLFTNHHCGYGQIQSHSSLENDYLTNGFWAKTRDEELPNPGLSVRFLDRMEDVTEAVLKDTEGLEADEKKSKIAANAQAVGRAAVAGSSGHVAEVKPLFHGNQYFMYVYKVYGDIRLVGAPPSAIGKFGGDTDNWMWPRHTGDFSVFRIYAGKDNEPAGYSPDNVPFRPAYFFPVSLDGVSNDDFVMVFGFPGSTDQYLPAAAVDLIQRQSDPDRIKIRTEKLDILSKHMERDPLIRIQYASKHAGTANSWKRWQGEVKGLKRMNAVETKRAFEDDFRRWYSGDGALKDAYNGILEAFDELYGRLEPFDRANNYYGEIVTRGTDILSLASMLPASEEEWNKMTDTQRNTYGEILLARLKSYYKDYSMVVDEEVFVSLMRMLREGVDPAFLPEGFVSIMDKYDDGKLLDKIYRKSILADEEAFTELAVNFDDKALKKLLKDPMVRFQTMLNEYYRHNVVVEYRKILDDIAILQKRYMAGIMEMKSGAALYPDANLTLRVAYGKVEGFEPADGVRYGYQTTMGGIMEKNSPDLYDYNVPQALRDLYEEGNFGRYADASGDMPVAFIASVHTTGGNSGSPAVNANGQLIGLNFDRCWEGTMSDIMFDPDRCRNIMVDIRYVLFLIDRLAGAGYLLDELTISGGRQRQAETRNPMGKVNTQS